MLSEKLRFVRGEKRERGWDCVKVTQFLIYCNSYRKFSKKFQIRKIVNKEKVNTEKREQS